MTFRWFTDVEPEKEGVKIKIQKSRKEPIQIIQIKKEQKFLNLPDLIKNAYEKFVNTKHQTLKILF